MVNEIDTLVDSLVEDEMLLNMILASLKKRLTKSSRNDSDWCKQVINITVDQVIDDLSIKELIINLKNKYKHNNKSKPKSVSVGSSSPSNLVKPTFSSSEPIQIIQQSTKRNKNKKIKQIILPTNDINNNNNNNNPIEIHNQIINFDELNEKLEILKNNEELLINNEYDTRNYESNDNVLLRDSDNIDALNDLKLNETEKNNQINQLNDLKCDSYIENYNENENDNDNDNVNINDNESIDSYFDTKNNLLKSSINTNKISNQSNINTITNESNIETNDNLEIEPYFESIDDIDNFLQSKQSKQSLNATNSPHGNHETNDYFSDFEEGSQLISAAHSKTHEKTSENSNNIEKNIKKLNEITKNIIKKVKFYEPIIKNIYFRDKFDSTEALELFYSHEEAQKFIYDYDCELNKAELLGLSWNDWILQRTDFDVKNDEEYELQRNEHERIEYGYGYNEDYEEDFIDDRNDNFEESYHSIDAIDDKRIIHENELNNENNNDFSYHSYTEYDDNNHNSNQQNEEDDEYNF